MDAAAVIEFWFGTHSDDGETARLRSQVWFGGHADTDRAIRDRFGALRESAVAGELSAWENDARGLLALIILVDQFSRNIFRKDPRAFEHDALARSWTLSGIGSGDDRKLRPIERVFFYLPLEHSEQLEDQERAVQLYESLVSEVPADQHDTFEEFAEYARRHRKIVARFGRFPHRNGVLGRESTADELAFLKEPGSSF